MGSTPSAHNEEVLSLAKEVFPSDAEWQEVSDLVNKRSSAKHIKYFRYRMHITRMFKILPSQPVMAHLVRLQDEKLGRPERLFHGTTPPRAEKILTEGFSLPARAGMFGKGIYFAKDPLKSIRYAQEGRRGSGLASVPRDGDSTPPGDSGGGAMSIGSWLSSMVTSTFSFAMPSSETVRHMLVCEVYLGKAKTCRYARPKFDPNRDFRRSWLWRKLGAREYNSVRAPGGTFGAVKVTEYVVYEPYQAIPRYLIEFDRVDAQRQARAGG